MESDKAKIFVGGISRETTEGILTVHFGKYGTVINSVVAKDRNTNSPRGFGFVLFSEPASAYKALQDTHVILGRTVEVKKAIPRTEQQQQPHHNPNLQPNSGFSRNGNDAADRNKQFRTKKIFVGGLSASLTEEEFKSYFERFGRITDVVVMHDSFTKRPKGFGFVTFEAEESVENVMQKTFHELNNRLVEVKRAVPREGNNGSHIDSRMMAGVVRGSPYSGFQQVEYSSNTPGYGIFPGYAPLPGYAAFGGYTYGTNVYGNGYPAVGYDRIGYGVPPVSPTGPIYAPVMFGARVFPSPYGNASFYPSYSYMNSGPGLMGAVPGAYHGILRTGMEGKSNHVVGGFVDTPGNGLVQQIGVNSDSPLGLKEHHGGIFSEVHQKGFDGQQNPHL